MIIRDNSGRALGTIEPDERDALAIVANDRKRTQQHSDPARPYGERLRATLDAMSRTGRVAFGVASTITVLAVVGAILPDETATATTYTAPRGTLDSVASERVAPFSGSTAADAANGWDAASLAANGDIRVSGHLVDNVNRTGSPLRVRYLQAFDANGIERGNESVTVREGVSFCGDIRNGEVSALREASDARSDAPTFGTGSRRMTVASAALTHFCPQFA